jgi:hypothetical protein
VRPDPPAVAPFFPHGAVTHVSVDPFPLGLPPRHVGPGRHDVWSVPRHSRAALAACHLPHRAHLVAAIADMRRLPPGTPKPTRSVPTVHAFGSILPAPATPRSPRCSPVRSSAHARWPPRRPRRPTASASQQSSRPAATHPDQHPFQRGAAPRPISSRPVCRSPRAGWSPRRRPHACRSF